MKRTVRLTESKLKHIISETVKRILKEESQKRGLYESGEIEIAPGIENISVTETSITTEWNGGITYEVGKPIMDRLKEIYTENNLKDSMNQAIAFSSKPWQLERLLNDYFGVKGKIV